jgi:hypothetical protein
LEMFGLGIRLGGCWSGFGRQGCNGIHASKL